MTDHQPSYRKGDWMQTYTGRQFWPIDPLAEEIDIADIAHALSMACRYAGHCLRFYSVAEHSVHVARSLPPELRLWGLLHDASEAYLVDVPRPLKPSLPGYYELEQRVMDAIAEKFWLHTNTMPAEVKAADNRILVDERQQNMAPTHHRWAGVDDLRPLGVTLEYWHPPRAEAEFIAAFHAYSNVYFT